MAEVTLVQLASNSPRRRELIALTDWKIGICVPQVDETPLAGEPPADYVMRLAQAKARAAVKDSPRGACIVAADTTVADGDDVLGKPAGAAQAESMLRRLRGRTHQVYTGLAVIDVDSGRMLTDVCITDVPMREYADAEIRQYVDSGDPLDKAGAYGIQHAGFHPVSRLHGCFASVMGMPLCHLQRLLIELQFTLRPGLPRRCQMYLQYDCPVSDAILRGEQVG